MDLLDGGFFVAWQELALETLAAAARETDSHTNATPVSASSSEAARALEQRDERRGPSLVVRGPSPERRRRHLPSRLFFLYPESLSSISSPSMGSLRVVTPTPAARRACLTWRASSRTPPRLPRSHPSSEASSARFFFFFFFFFCLFLLQALQQKHNRRRVLTHQVRERVLRAPRAFPSLSQQRRERGRYPPPSPRSHSAPQPRECNPRMFRPLPLSQLASYRFRYR